MVLLGCNPKGRLTEQHDVFFGVAENLTDLVPSMDRFWPDSGGLHVDAWRELAFVDHYRIQVISRKSVLHQETKLHLFFINLGGYKPGEFEEFHSKILIVANSSADALKQAKQSRFFKQTSISGSGGASHIDDKYGFDVDDVHRIEDVWSESEKLKYELLIEEVALAPKDELQIGYIAFSKL
jgi:hypothetical protein